MQSFIILSVFVTSEIMLSFIMPSVVMLNVIMLSVVYLDYLVLNEPKAASLSPDVIKLFWPNSANKKLVSLNMQNIARPSLMLEIDNCDIWSVPNYSV